MEQSATWEANWFSTSHEIPHIHKCLTPVPILSQLDPVHTSTSHFLKIHLNIISHLSLSLPSGLFPSGFPIKTLYIPFILQYALHALPNSFFSILSPKQYHSVPHYIAFSTPITSSLLGPNILSTLFSNTSASFPPSLWVTKFHTHTKQQAKL